LELLPFLSEEALEMRYILPMPQLTVYLRHTAMVLAFVVCSAALQSAAQTAPARPPAPTPAPLTAEADRQRLLDLLGIKQSQVDPNDIWPYKSNFDESKAAVYSNLPDPLLLKNGKRVTSAQVWWTQRRPEIVEDFDREIYGRIPANLPKVTWEVASTMPEKIGYLPVVTKRLVGHVDNSMDPQITVNIELTLTTPANASAPVPVILELAFAGEFKASMVRPLSEKGTGSGDYGQTWQRLVLEKGWGYAVLSPTSFQADDGAGLTEGIIGLANQGQPRKLDDWGVLRAWAWGASRALDYFETDKSVDARQVGIQGHSRMGKASLVAMAYDPRFAIGYISASGEGGAKLYRHIFGEQITCLASAREYHWMAGNFLKYAGPLTPGDLPVDSHELIALVAPRPVFIGVGASQGDGYATQGADGWADGKGMFLAEAGAGPVYRLLGKKDLGATEIPPIGTALIDGDLGFLQHPGGHTPVPNWPTFLDFASRYLYAPGAVAASGSAAH
jgi:hypothetical protein